MPEPGPPALKKLDLTIARLRLLLADVTAREAALQDQRRTCRDQHDKLITFCMYGDTNLDTVLSMLGDVEERQAGVEATPRPPPRLPETPRDRGFHAPPTVFGGPRRGARRHHQRPAGHPDRLARLPG